MARAVRRWSAATVALAAVAGTVWAAAAPSVHAQAATVAANVPVTAEDERLAPANNSPELRVDPTDPRVVALASRLDNPDFGCALHLSGDSGRDWLPANPVLTLPPGVDKCYAPEIAFDRAGTLYYLFIGLHGGGNSPVGAFVVTTKDRGRTFSEPRQVLGAERYMVRMALDSTVGTHGRLHFVWLEARSTPPVGGLPAPPNPIMAAYSDDGGATMSPPQQVSDPQRPLAVAPALAVEPDHAVHILYYDLGRDLRDYLGLQGPKWSDPWSIVMTTSRDGGRHFDRGVVVDDAVVPVERVMLIYTMPPPAVAAGDRGIVLAAWSDARNGDADVFLRRSADGGSVWSAPLRLNDDALHDGRRQSLPQLAVAPGGQVDAVFYDRRNAPANDRADVYYTQSTDRGVSFGANVRLTSESSDTQIGPRYPLPSAQGLVEFGSRIAVVAGASGVIAAWADTRNAEPDTYAEDIFATTVDTASGAGDARRPIAIGVAAGGAVLAFGAAATWLAARRRAAPLARTGSRQRVFLALACAGVAVTIVFTLIASQSASPGAPTAAVLPLPAHLAVSMHDNAFAFSGPVPRGRVVFDVTNRGPSAHELTLVFLPEDLPPIEEQLHSPTRHVVARVAHLHGRPAGANGTFAVNLAPGRYAMIDFLSDANGVQHALVGMASEFRVR